LKKRLYFLALSLSVLCPYLAAQNPFIRNYASFDGLPSNNVYQVYQDSKKFLWFVTDAGVARYDGTAFMIFSKHDGLSCNDVVHVKEDSRGRVWFFNMDASLNYYLAGKIYNPETAPFLDSLESVEFFRDFYEDQNQTLYFYHNHQREIYTLDTLDRVEKFKFPSVFVMDYLNRHMIDGMDIRFLNQSAEGDFHLWTIAGLFKLSSMKQKPVPTGVHTSYKAVFTSARGKFIVTNLPMQNIFEIRKLKDEYEPDPSQTPIITSSEFVSQVLEDDNGFVWVSTYDQGVTCYKDGQKVRHYDIPQAQAIIQDHERNIWVTSLKDGAYKISPFLNQYLHLEPENFENKGILALADRHEGGVWMANGSQIYLLNDTGLLSMDFRPEKYNLNQLLQVDSKTLLAGEISTKYYALGGISIDARKGRVNHQTVIESPSTFKSFSANRDRSEITTWNFFTAFRMSPPLFENIRSISLGERIYNVFFRADGTILVNSNKNYIYRNDSLIRDKSLAIIDKKIITGHLALSPAIDLYNIEGDSLYLVRQGTIRNLSGAWDYPSGIKVRHMSYTDSILFLATTTNLFFCRHPMEVLEGRPVDIIQMELSFRNIHDILVKGNKLYVASDDGLTAISETPLRKFQAKPPIPYFQFVRINEDDELIDQREIVVTGRNRILVDYSCLNYSSSPAIYSYRLDGLDVNWQTGTDDNVVYENLPSGRYTFWLRVRKPSSDWSDPISCTITVKAPFWQHPVFYVSLILLFAGVLVLIILFRKNAEIKRRDMEHQLLVMEQRALQSMMNPHFIFNSLGSIQNYLLQRKPREAALYLSQFARLIRQNINASNSAMINLEEEIDRLKNYLDLEKMRMENKFEYRIRTDEKIAAEDALIPSMLIQPFVENSIWHGLRHREENGLIAISFRLNDKKTMIIVIEDNGIGMQHAESRSSNSERHLGMGVAITRKRLELIGKKYNVKTSVDISQSQATTDFPGTRIELTVPFEYEKEGQPPAP
jgi:two-component sensor histidine kinase